MFPFDSILRDLLRVSTSKDGTSVCCRPISRAKCEQFMEVIGLEEPSLSWVLQDAICQKLLEYLST